MIHSSTQAQNTPSRLTQGSMIHIPTAEIYVNTPNNTVRSGKTVRLIQSIKKYGLSSPIVVTPTEVFPGIFRYLVLEGEELWHAACLAGLAEIPCLIAPNTPQETEIAEIFAKIASKSADMFEKAVLFRHLTDTYGLTQEEISRRAGLSQSAVANKLRLLHLTAAEQKKILLHGLSERHARALLRLKTPETRLSVLEAVCKRNLSVAATEALIESYLWQEVPSSPKFTPSPVNKAQTQSNFSPDQKEKQFKFVLHSLQPLYNSLERTLNIFRKTGRNAILDSVQTPDGLLITITIPNP